METLKSIWGTAICQGAISINSPYILSNPMRMEDFGRWLSPRIGLRIHIQLQKEAQYNLSGEKLFSILTLFLRSHFSIQLLAISDRLVEFAQPDLYIGENLQFYRKSRASCNSANMVRKPKKNFFICWTKFLRNPILKRWFSILLGSHFWVVTVMMFWILL